MSRLHLLVVVSAAACLGACHKNADKTAASGSGSASVPSATATPPAAPASGRGITLHLKLTVSGSVTATGDMTQKLDDFATCADYAAKFTMPDVEGAKLDNGKKLSLSDSPTKYHGPGTYAAADLDANATLAIDNTDEPYQPFGKESTRSLVVNADGSGTYTFASWPDPGSHTISGSVTWTCSS